MFSQLPVDIASLSSSSETFDSKSSDGDVSKQNQKYGYNQSYPVRWDDLPSNVEVPTNIRFSLQSIFKSLQPEYWWNRYSSGHRTKYVGHFDKRYELTEYQLIREVIWVLLGAENSFVSQLTKIQGDIIFKPHLVCLNHLSDGALDSFLHKFASWNDHVQFLRFLVQFVVSKMDFTSHPCIFAFVDCVNEFLSQLDHFLHKLECKSRGCGIFTLISLHQCLLPWYNRAKILTKVIRDTIESDLQRLREAHTVAKLLDTIYSTAAFMEDCNFDQYAVFMLHTTFVYTFSPFLSSLFKLFSGSTSYSDSFVQLFVDIDHNIPPNDPRFWHTALKPKKKKIGISDVPCIFFSVLDQIFDVIKALFLIISICEETADYSFLEKIAIDPSQVRDEFRLTYLYLLSEKQKAFKPDCYECPVSLQTYSTFDRPNNSAKSLKLELENFVCKQRMLINQQLLSITLPHLSEGGIRSIGDCLTTVGAVYLFGAGDKMNDFARQFFCIVSSLNNRKLDSAGLTINLQGYFNDTSRNSQGQNVFRYLEYSFFVFGVQKMDCSFNSRSTNSRLDLIKDLSLNYHVDWPANIILDEKSITVYNGVFLFLLQIKYTKWSLENLRLSSLRREMSKHFPFDHYLIVLRIKMLFVFTSLHDFLAHKIEAIRIQFSSKWCLPDCSYPKDINFSIPETLSFSDLVQDHNNLISELQSVCLLTESCSLLFTEIHNLCSMGLQLQDLWISNLSSGSNNSICKEKLEILSDQFGSHVKFLSSMLTRVVCSSNNNQLSYLSTCFKIAASFSSDISKPVSSK